MIDKIIPESKVGVAWIHSNEHAKTSIHNFEADTQAKKMELVFVYGI